MTYRGSAIAIRLTEAVDEEILTRLTIFRLCRFGAEVLSLDGFARQISRFGRARSLFQGTAAVDEARALK